MEEYPQRDVITSELGTCVLYCLNDSMIYWCILQKIKEKKMVVIIYKDSMIIQLSIPFCYRSLFSVYMFIVLIYEDTSTTYDKLGTCTSSPLCMLPDLTR